MQQRTKRGEEVLSMMSGESKDAISTQTVAILKSFEKEEREKVIKKLDTVVNVPPGHVASMKASLNILEGN